MLNQMKPLFNMETLNVYDQLHFVCSKLHTGLHVIELQNSDLAMEILQNEPSKKWIGIAETLKGQKKILTESMNFMLRMRTELERLAKQNKGYEDFRSQNMISSLEKQVETLQNLLDN